MASFYGDPDPPIRNMVNQIPNMDVDHGLPTIPPPPQDGTVKEKRVSTVYSTKESNFFGGLGYWDAPDEFHTPPVENLP